MSSEVQPKCTSSSAAGVGARDREAVAHVVLDGLDIVIDARLDRLDGRGGIRGRIAAASSARPRQHGGVDRRERAVARPVGERQKPQRLDAHTLAHQPRLGEATRAAAAAAAA